jgi:hypothetical protein
MRIVGVCAVLLTSACGLSLLAQQPQASEPASTPPASSSPAPTSQTPESQTTGSQTTGTQSTGTQTTGTESPDLTPIEQREQQIRQFDPLDRGEDKESRAREKAARDAEKRRDDEQTPLPGSIAATERDQSRPDRGPQVSEDDTTEEPVQEYTGPAVLSRSYSVSRPLIPQQLKWTESVGINFSYNSGAIETVNANGSLSSAALLGTMVNWAISGRHYFRRDQIAVNYAGSYSQYGAGPSAFNGLNNSIAVDYSHVLSRRVRLNVTGLGSMLSQNYVLDNATLSPETSVANINLASSPNIQITDAGTKQFSTQIDLTFQQSSRLSFDGGVSYFAVVRDAPGLLGMTGEQGRGDMNYRLTRQMTVGAYYSYSYYIFPQGFGTTDTNTVGAIFSYAFTSTMQLRLRGGISYVNSREFQPAIIAPYIAALLGQTSGLIDAYTKVATSDISAQFVKDFRRGKTFTVAYAHGISPGNGIYQTSEQQSMSANFGMRFFRTYQLGASVGRDTLTAVGVSQATLGSYASEYGRITLSRGFHNGVALNFAAEFRHYVISNSAVLENQLHLTSGVSWGPPGGKLWPF